MDIVYVCRSGENEELRYSIRSAIANLPHDNIWVVGGKPDWYSGNFIQVPLQNSGYFQVWENLRYAINDDRISNSFIVMNDDFFVVKKVDSVEPQFCETLEGWAEYRRTDNNALYLNKFFETSSRLYRMNRIKDPLNYELHIPMVFEKDKLLPILGKYALYRSAYGNIHNVGGTNARDVKVYNVRGMDEFSFDYKNSDSSYLSTDDHSFAVVYQDMLAEMFSTPSEYELDMVQHML